MLKKDNSTAFYEEVVNVLNDFEELTMSKGINVDFKAFIWSDVFDYFPYNPESLDNPLPNHIKMKPVARSLNVGSDNIVSSVYSFWREGDIYEHCYIQFSAKCVKVHGEHKYIDPQIKQVYLSHHKPVFIEQPID